MPITQMVKDHHIRSALFHILFHILGVFAAKFSFFCIHSQNSNFDGILLVKALCRLLLKAKSIARHMERLESKKSPRFCFVSIQMLTRRLIVSHHPDDMSRNLWSVVV